VHEEDAALEGPQFGTFAATASSKREPLVNRLGVQRCQCRPVLTVSYRDPLKPDWSVSDIRDLDLINQMYALIGARDGVRRRNEPSPRAA
jgi:hypothetical protein